MMKKLKDKFIVTFPTTVAALAMEDVCRSCAAPGRLIPVPVQISAGCGMCWCAEPEQEEQCRYVVQEHDLSYESFHRI